MKVVGKYHVLWVPVLVSLSDAQEETPALEHYKTQYPPCVKELVSDDQVLVWLELGKQSDCGPAISSLLRGDFFEAKANLPFVQNPAEPEQLLTIKGAVVMNNYVNSWGSQLVHSLHTTYSRNFSFSNSTYCIEFGSDRRVQFNFQAEGEYLSWKEIPSLEELYGPLCALPWTGTLSSNFKNPKNNKLTLQPMTFDFEQARVRPAQGVLDITPNTLPFFPSGGQFTVPSISSVPTGAVEVIIPFEM